MNEKKREPFDAWDRIEIQKCLTHGMSFKAIGQRLGKDQTTISKEVKCYRTVRVNQILNEYRPKVLKALTNEEGTLLRMNRFIQEEGVFGVLKEDYGFRRFLTRGKKNVETQFFLGSFSASINASFKLYWTIDDIGNYLNKFHEHSLYIEKVKKFIEYEPQIKGEETEVPAFESLTIKNLDFVYPFTKDEKKTLKGLDLEIKKGEKVAFVGYNGAGKTTLAFCNNSCIIFYIIMERRILKMFNLQSNGVRLIFSIKSV